MQPDTRFKEAVRLAGSGDLGRAETLCRKALQADAQDVNMLALLGAILLRGSRLDEAEQRLLEAIAMAPEFAKPHEDLAVLYMHGEKFALAAEYFRKAADIDATQASVFFGLSHALHKLGHTAMASDAYTKFLKLSPDSNSLAQVVSLRQSGDLAKARVECGRLLAREPDNLPAMRQLAMIAAQEGQSPEAERLLLRMAALSPGSILPVKDLANFFADQHRYVEAIAWYERAIELAPADPDMRLGLAQSLSVVGKADVALDAYSACLDLDSKQTAAMLGRGHALRALGRSSEAIEVYRQCLRHEDVFAHACWSLAGMANYAFSDEELVNMRARRRASGNSDVAVTHLDFAIAKAMDDLARYADAWPHYVAGNARQRAAAQYDGVDFETGIDTLINTYTEAFCQRKSGSRTDQSCPIFVLGMPRSGSTLIEQILASHSQVEGTTELPYLKDLAIPLHAGSGTTPAPIVDTGDDRLNALGERYLEASAIHRPEKKPYFVDKLPDNFPYVGFIQLILPHAIVIDARREPLDTCVANFRQLFARGKEFSYDLGEMGEMYLQYLRIMQHWDDVLAGKVLTVHYEDVVQDTEQQIRRVLAHCGLEWEDACLDFSNTPRTITTASSEQVRQPIYTGSIGYWRHYEANLKELREILQPILGY